jgi:hypothetical protein
MLDKIFVEKVQIAIKTYAADHALTDEEDNVLTEFTEWLYKQYGIVYEK